MKRWAYVLLLLAMAMLTMGHEAGGCFDGGEDHHEPTDGGSDAGR